MYSQADKIWIDYRALVKIGLSANIHMLCNDKIKPNSPY